MVCRSSWALAKVKQRTHRLASKAPTMVPVHCTPNDGNEVPIFHFYCAARYLLLPNKAQAWATNRKCRPAKQSADDGSGRFHDPVVEVLVVQEVGGWYINHWRGKLMSEWVNEVEMSAHDVLVCSLLPSVCFVGVGRYWLIWSAAKSIEKCIGVPKYIMKKH